MAGPWASRSTDVPTIKHRHAEARQIPQRARLKAVAFLGVERLDKMRDVAEDDVVAEIEWEILVANPGLGVMKGYARARRTSRLLEIGHAHAHREPSPTLCAISVSPA